MLDALLPLLLLLLFCDESLVWLEAVEREGDGLMLLELLLVENEGSN